MSKQTINIGASPNDGTGTPLRTSFDYTNQNFTELYTALGGGVGLPGATTQVIFNDGGTNLAGDAGLVYNKTTDALTVAGLVTAGSATITGDLTVDTSTLKVDSANNYVGIGTASPVQSLTISGEASVRVGDVFYWNGYYNAGFKARAAGYAAYISESGTGDLVFANTSTSAAGAGSAVTFRDRYRIDKDGVHTWEYVSNVAGTAMTLNSTGLGIGASPASKLYVYGANVSGIGQFRIDCPAAGVAQQTFAINGVGQGNIYHDGAQFVIGSVTSTPLFLRTANTVAVTIDASQNVGIGVTPTTIVGASGVNGKGLQGDSWTISSQGGTNDSYFANNLYTSAYTVWSNRVNAASGAYYISGGTHIFYRGAAQAPGTITPTESARIDASGNLILQPSSTPPSLFANGQLTVNATSNTNLRFSYRGSDGTTRVANITLA